MENPLKQNSLILCFGEVMMRLSPKDNLRVERVGGRLAREAVGIAASCRVK